jgi:hypothetical protein
MQFAMALRALSGTKPVKMAVNWKGRRETLTEMNIFYEHLLC